MNEEKKNTKHKMIFAKATAYGYCAITVYENKEKLMVCDIVESGDIDQFIEDLSFLARKHIPELVQYECTVYMHECTTLRNILQHDNIKVRGYKSEGTYINRIVSQAHWIESNVLVNEIFPSFIDKMTSFNISDPDKTNIALDVLSDATQYLRRFYFK
ncbi:hypothetical protein [Dysgonomonas sp. BGC7]|uniref:hypothetical protein n=1 Tax=Dysgonomonas sp. BGC7 TaxID=1658008 RepID=UPI000682641F|nr:hypothetical protein [Dysgonomonas sp. BGC7]MBD8389653.1 hypothetical protein [Dysgonomonas sp. BGC7]